MPAFCFAYAESRGLVETSRLHATLAEVKALACETQNLLRTEYGEDPAEFFVETYTRYKEPETIKVKDIAVPLVFLLHIPKSKMPPFQLFDMKKAKEMVEKSKRESAIAKADKAHAEVLQKEAEKRLKALEDQIKGDALRRKRTSIPISIPEDELEHAKETIGKLEDRLTQLKQSYERRLRESQGRLKTASDALNDARAAINSLKRRTLHDEVRLKIADLLGLRDWKDVKKAFPSFQAQENAIANLLPNHECVAQLLQDERLLLKAALHPEKFRRQGNIVAHTASKEQLGEAVAATEEGEKKRIMTQAYLFVFGEYPPSL